MKKPNYPASKRKYFWLMLSSWEAAAQLGIVTIAAVTSTVVVGVTQSSIPIWFVVVVFACLVGYAATMLLGYVEGCLPKAI